MPLSTRSGSPAFKTERFRILGRVGATNFSDWIEAHARRLGLSGEVVAQSAQCLELIVSGPPELVDAMAVGCSLGPIEVWVETIERDVQAPSA